MNYQGLKSAILANQSCQPYVVTNDMPKDPDCYTKDKAIADILNNSADFNFVVVSGPIRRGDFLRKLGPVAGSALFSRIKTVSASYQPLSYIVAELESDGVIVPSLQELQSFLALLSGLMGWESGDMALIESVFTEKEQVTPQQVSIALRNY